MATVYYGPEDVKKDKKGNYYLTTEDTTDQQSIELMGFRPYEEKGVKITASSSYSGTNRLDSTNYSDTINIKNGKYSINLNGNGIKKVTTSICVCCSN